MAIDRNDFSKIWHFRLTGLRNGLNVAALDDDFVLLRSRHHSDHTIRQRHAAHDFFAQEVSDLKFLPFSFENTSVHFLHFILFHPGRL